MNFRKFILEIINKTDDIIKFEDFDFGNILIDEKSRKSVLVYNISHKTISNHYYHYYVLGSIK